MIENTRIRFGRYKGISLKDIPNDYLEWVVKNNVLKGKAMIYAKKRIGFPKDKWKITVEDSLGQDGDYFTEAYSERLAINKVIRDYKIQGSQSGTYYSATKI